jgi:hypothetical protein
MNVIADRNSKFFQAYEWKGRQHGLVADGAVDHVVWDQISLSDPSLCKDDWMVSVREPRLVDCLHSHNKTAQEQALLLGQDWKAEGKSFVVGNPEGSHQRLEVSGRSPSGANFSLTTVIKGGPHFESAMHIIKGRTSPLGIPAEQIVEELRLA